MRQIDPVIVAEIDRILDSHTDRDIANILNARGLQPGVVGKFSPWIIWRVRIKHSLEDRRSRLRRQGLLTLQETATALHVHPCAVQARRAGGQLTSVVYNDRGQRLYVPPGAPVTIGCSHCGKTIPERAAHGQRQKYCSVTCPIGAYATRRLAAGWVRVQRTRSPAAICGTTPSLPSNREVQSVA